MEKRKTAGVGGLLNFPKLSWPFKKRKEKEPEDDVFYPLDQAQDNWKKAMHLYRSGRYDQATIHFRRSLTMLLKANCPGFTSSAENNLLSLAKKAFHTIPEDIKTALIFINPHYALVKSAYSTAFVDDIYERSKIIAEWVFSQSSYSSFDLEVK